MKISILTLFPEMFQGPFSHSIVRRAIEKRLVEIEIINFRDFGIGKHKTVDDKPYGGGKGMVIRVDVLDKALNKSFDKRIKRDKQKSILLTPHGKTFNQKAARKLSKLNHLIIICGHYEGVDSRFETLVDEKISIGDFITTGGEIPTMLIVDSVVRLIKGVLKEGVTQSESFPKLLEYPQYTKPQEYKKMRVPKILLSGNHKKIEEYRNKESEKITEKLRPDLLRTKNSED